MPVERYAVKLLSDIKKNKFRENLHEFVREQINLLHWNLP
jgi:hypothetical protein